ncbi:MAG: type II 3-dehydroquinate dehydratase [Candidatus Aegiribacteria sp.]|nr:type II 3-dehydroquinate dehydratase [Candidatus Aegiribacteria sp.]
MAAESILVINGPSLSRLGFRQPEIYGSSSLDDLEDMLGEHAASKSVDLAFFQSDVEGELVRAVNEGGLHSGLVINPAAYSHYSIAIMDAMLAFQGPVAEVHISNVFSRESFRRDLVTAMGADVFISGAGLDGYIHALDIVCGILHK